MASRRIHAFLEIPLGLIQVNCYHKTKTGNPALSRLSSIFNHKALAARCQWSLFFPFYSFCQDGECFFFLNPSDRAAANFYLQISFLYATLPTELQIPRFKNRVEGVDD